MHVNLCRRTAVNTGRRRMRTWMALVAPDKLHTCTSSSAARNAAGRTGDPEVARTAVATFWGLSERQGQNAGGVVTQYAPSAPRSVREAMYVAVDELSHERSADRNTGLPHEAVRLARA